MGILRISPGQSLFDALFALLQDLGYQVYDYLPAGTAPYPFVYIGQVQTVPMATKSNMLATLDVTIQVWGTRKQRPDVDQIGQDLIEAAVNLQQTDFYYVQFAPQGSYTTVRSVLEGKDVLSVNDVVLEFRLR